MFNKNQKYKYFVHNTWKIVLYIGVQVNPWSGKTYHKFSMEGSKEVLLTNKQASAYIS